MNRPISPVRPKPDDDVQVAYLADWAATAEQRRARRRAIRTTLLSLAAYLASFLLAAAVLGLIATAWATTGDNRFGALFAGLVAAITGAYLYLTREY